MATDTLIYSVLKIQDVHIILEYVKEAQIVWNVKKVQKVWNVKKVQKVQNVWKAQKGCEYHIES